MDHLVVSSTHQCEVREACGGERGGAPGREGPWWGLAVDRVGRIVTVDEVKVRARFHRLWRYVGDAVKLSDRAHVYDNTRAATPFRLVASFFGGHVTGTAHWPEWTPSELRQAGSA